MIHVPLGVNADRYMERHLHGTNWLFLGLEHLAVHITTSQLKGKVDRSGHPQVEHLLAVSDMSKEFFYNFLLVLICVLHDVFEDGKIKARELSRSFGPIFGPLVTFGVKALTKEEHGKFNSDEERDLYLRHYFDQIIEAASKRHFLLFFRQMWQIPFAKLLDRLHNLRRPHGGSEKAELRMLRETIEGGDFYRMAIECRMFIPKCLLAKYNEIFDEILYRAHLRLAELTAAGKC
ncbi:MAG: hypothetical protein WC107_03470 [Patescibacteria group bacterium]